jgi:hypothetical protein
MAGCLRQRGDDLCRSAWPWYFAWRGRLQTNRKRRGKHLLLLCPPGESVLFRCRFARLHGFQRIRVSIFLGRRSPKMSHDLCLALPEGRAQLIGQGANARLIAQRPIFHAQDHAPRLQAREHVGYAHGAASRPALWAWTARKKHRPLGRQSDANTQTRDSSAPSICGVRARLSFAGRFALGLHAALRCKRLPVRPGRAMLTARPPRG